MKYNKIKTFFFYSLTTFIFFSCSKELDKTPTDTIPEDKVFLTTDDIKKGVNGAVQRMSTYANELKVNALLSDEAKLGPQNSGDGALTYKYQYSSDNVSGDDVVSAWSGYYSCIQHCNLILNAIPKVTGDSLVKDDYKAQLLVIRAFAHFQLLQAYAGNFKPNSLGIPYTVVDDIYAKPIRLTMGEVMSRIEKDFDDAMPLFLNVTAGSYSDAYVNRLMAVALRSKIAFYKGNYRMAIDLANEFMRSNARRLTTTLSDFRKIWEESTTADRTVERIFGVRYETSAAIGSLWGTTAGDIGIAPSTKLVDAINANANDFRKQFIQKDSKGFVYVSKYRGSTRGGNADSKVVDLKVMRVAELILIRAESYARLSTPVLDSGMVDLQTIRNARGIPGSVTGMDQNALLNAILDERFKELCFEGTRFWDLRRFDKPVSRLAADASSEWRSLPANSFRFVLPIPFDEMLANPNMKQNPGYN